MRPPNDDLDGLGVSLADLGLEEDSRAQRSAPSLAPEPADFTPPKVIDGLPFADYHADPDSIGASGMRLIIRSPAHYWYRYLGPGRGLAAPTDTQILGTAIHCAVLEPFEFPKRFVRAPQCDRRTKEGKAIFKEFCADAGNRTVLKPDTYDAALEVAVAVRSTYSGTRFLGDGKAETSIFWTDAATGVRCRIRPDFLPNDQPLIIDLKSCVDASDSAFTASAWRNGYHVTAALYIDGYKAATGEDREYVFCAWEKEPPHAGQWFYADETLIEAGRDAYRRALSIYAKCRESNNWPAYPSQLIPLFPPAWAVDPKER